jgi:hypothetical protein
MALRNQGVLGVYAGIDSATKKVSVVLINKDVTPVGLYIANIPTGKYFMRHFGGQAGVAKWQVRSFSSIHTAGKTLMLPCIDHCDNHVEPVRCRPVVHKRLPPATVTYSWGRSIISKG